jgi:hypothetical protein
MSDQREAGASLPSLRLSRLIREAQAVLLAISVGYFTQQSELERATGDWRMGRFGWSLKQVQPLSQPVETKGYQRLRQIEDLNLRKAITDAIHMNVAANGS